MNELTRWLDQLPSAVIVPFLAIMILVYLLPTIVAAVVRRPNLRSVFAVNLVSGLSWPAWFATLAWAMSGESGRRPGTLTQAARTRALIWPLLILALIAAGLIANHG